MRLESFRELLVKKSQDVSLQNIVRFMHDDVLAEFIIESLEKMARSSHKGDAANFAIRDFGTEMDPAHEPSMIHDALSHHVSHYKSALNNGNQGLANQHAKQVFRIMDLADQAQKHSHGKLQVDAVPPQPWERNAKAETFGDRIAKLKTAQENGEPLSEKEQKWISDNPVTRGDKKPDQFITDTKSWRHRGNDFTFLQQAPHQSYSAEIRRHGHDNAYPMEHIKINGKYVDVENIDPQDSYKSHPFDSHPVLSHFEEPAKHRTPERDKQYVESRDSFNESPELDKYFAGQEAREQANPEAYQKRGSERASAVHKQVDPLDTSNVVPKIQAEPGLKTKLKPAPSAAPAKLSAEDKKAMMDRLPPELQQKFARLFQDEDK